MRRIAINIQRVLRDRSGLGRQLIDATIGSAGVRIAGMAVTFLVGVQLARYLGPGGYGVYGTVMAISALLIVPAQFGLPQLITREISVAQARRANDEITSVLLWFTLSVFVASIAMVLVGVVGFHFWMGGIKSNLASAFYWGLGLVPLFALTNLGASALRGVHHVVKAQAFEALLRPAVFAILLFAAASNDFVMEATTALSLNILAALLTLVICALVIYRVMPRSATRPASPKHKRYWMASAIPFAGTEILRVIDGNFGILLLGILVQVEDVGFFRVALATAAFIAFPSTVFNLIVMPYVAKMHAEQDRRRLQWLASTSAFISFTCTLFLTLIIYFFGVPLIAAVFGKAYTPAWTTLVVMGTAYTVNAFFGICATILNMCGRERIVTLAYALGLVLSAPLAYVLVGDYGIVGMAIAMLSSELFKGAMMWQLTRRSFGIDTAAIPLFHPPWRKNIP